MADSDLAMAIREHPNIRMIEVNESNREELIPVVLEFLKDQLG